MIRRWGLLEVNTTTGNVKFGTRSGNFEYRAELVLLFFGGIVMSRIVMWSAPVHEFAHVVAAWLSGSPARIVSWTQSWALRPTPFVLWVGYQAETVFVMFLAWLSYRRGFYEFTAVALGTPLVFMYEWGASGDRMWLMSRGHVGWADSAVPFMVAWYILGLVCLRKRRLAD